MDTLVPLESKKVTVWIFGLWLLAVAPLAFAVDEFPEQPVLEDYLSWASENHPRLTGARARSEVARQEVAVAGSLPDLKLAWGEMIVPVETRVGPQQRVFSVSQSLPWFGTLGEKQAAAEARALSVESRLRAENLEVRRQIRTAWLDLASLQQEIVLTENHLALSLQSEEAALGSYEAGTARFRNVLQAQMESDNLRNGLESLRDRVTPATVTLNIRAGLPADTSSPEALLPKVADNFSSLDLKKILFEGNPKLESLRRLEEGHRHGFEAARLSGRPGLTLGLDYMMTGSARMTGVDDSGKDPVIARVAINVPLWSGKATARRLASASRLQAASSDWARLRLELERELENTLYRLRDAGRTKHLYQDSLVPRARQILQASTADYQAGQATFDEVIGARENLLGLELARLRAATDQALALNDLEALLGSSTESINHPNGKEF